MSLHLKLKSLATVLAVGIASLSVMLPVTAQGQDIYHVQIANPELIVANQNCQNWCWAASSEMLVRSQGIFDVLQTEFVRRIYGPALPCLPTFGSFEPIKQAIEGIYTLPGGAQIALSGAYHYGVPTDVAGMIHSIEDGRPFIFAWQGHAWVAYGIKYFYTSPFYHSVHRDRTHRPAGSTLGRYATAIL